MPLRSRRKQGWRRLVVLSAWVTGTIAALTTAVTATASPPLPRVVSLNLCTDLQLLLLADPEQIVSLTWLASDARSSPLAEAAQRYPKNRGLGEEVLTLAPDVVLVGSYTTRFTVDLLRRLGVRVVEIEPVTSLDEVEQSMLVVGSAIGQRARAVRLNAAFRAAMTHSENVWRNAQGDAAPPIRAVLIGAGGFSGGTHTLAGSVLSHVGLSNIAGRGGDNDWGRFSIEDLLRLQPDLLIVTVDSDDRKDPSLALAALDHPALRTHSLAMQRLEIPATYWACGTPLVVRAAALLAAARTSRQP